MPVPKIKPFFALQLKALGMVALEFPVCGTPLVFEELTRAERILGGEDIEREECQYDP